MKYKNIVIVISIFICLIVIGIIGSYFVMNRQISNHTVIITQDSKELYRIAMDSVDEPYTIEIKGENNELNRVLISKEKIQMEYASCPDGLCVKQGAISDGILPIVCLPNKVYIQIVDGNNETEDLDAKVG